MTDATNSLSPYPTPKQITFGNGRYTAGNKKAKLTGVDNPVARTRLEQAVQRHQLSAFSIDFKLLNESVSHPDIDSSYRYEIEVSKDSVRVQSDSIHGSVVACSTLGQLVSDGSLPVTLVKDQPTYAWRGIMLDVARHYLRPDVLYETLDLMDVFRLNVLHLHLSDDQGFRFQSKLFPRLNSGSQYSQAELSSLVNYASDRAIRIVPEIDVPGHTTALLAAYPSWASRTQVDESTGFGVHRACLDPSAESTYANLEALFAEIASTFPDTHCHIGGDEVNPHWWENSCNIQRWMARNNLETVQDAQAWFNRRIVEQLRSAGKTVIGWDEVSHPDLDRSVVIQAWRGMRPRDTAVANGHDCIVSSPYYLDLHYPSEAHYQYWPDMSEASWQEAHHAVCQDPRVAHVQDGVESGQEFGQHQIWHSEGLHPPGKILGGEACLWSELVTSELASRRLWSRMGTIAERYWNGVDACSVELANGAVNRLFDLHEGEREHYFNLPAKVRDRIPALQSVLDQLEPVKWYARLLGMRRVRARVSGQSESSLTRPYDLQSGLNQLIDYLPPESTSARALYKRYCNDGDLSEIASDWSSVAELVRDPSPDTREALSDIGIQEAEFQTLVANLVELSAIANGDAPLNLRVTEPVEDYLLPITSMVVRHEFTRILKHWDLTGFVCSLGAGHINDTYQVGDSHVLQRINSHVFPNPELVIRNAELIYPALGPLALPSVHTNDGRPCVSGQDGSMWRVIPYADSRVFVDEFPTELCQGAGRAFGEFANRLQDLDANLEPVIPNFHDFDSTFEELQSTVAFDEVADLEEKIVGLVRDIDYPATQVIHGDCKPSNLLFHPKEEHVLHVIDLDTVMYGHPALDFGDLLRSIAGSGAADEVEERLTLTARGYRSQYEVDSGQHDRFAYAPIHMSLLLACRYITDHFRGDQYFRVSQPGENLQKGLARLDLAEQLNSHKDLIRTCLQSEKI